MSVTPGSTPWKYRGATSVHYGSIAAIEFDPEMELLWVCDSFGTVASFYCVNPSLEELSWHTYCNLRCFPDSHPGCTGIRFVNNGTETLAAIGAANSFTVMKRGGANVIRQAVPTHLQHRVTLFDVDYMRSGLVLAGNSPGLLRYTLDVPGEFVHIPSEGTITAMLSSDNWFAMAMTNGQVTLRDPSTLRQTDVVRAFNSRVCGLDGNDTTLLVASMERPNTGTVKVFDTRKSATPVQTILCNQTSSIVSLRFQAMPNGSAPRALLLTPQGFHVVQLDQPSPIFSSTQSIESGLCSAAAISSNGQCAAIGNDKGYFFALSSIPTGELFNFSGGVQPNLPKVPNFTVQWKDKDGAVDGGFSYACPEEQLHSSWPERDYMLLAVDGKVRQVVRAEQNVPTLNQLGIHRSCAYLPDPKDKINQVLPNPYPFNSDLGDDPSKVSKILQDLRKSKRAIPRARGDAATMLYAKPDEALQLCYHTHNTTFDWRNYNFSPDIVGLDNTVPGSWIAPLLQCMYLCQHPYYPIRRTVIRHWCTKQYCMTCEVAILFSNMIVTRANGTAPIGQIGNLIRTMMQLPVFTDSGIFVPATSRDDAVFKMHQAQKLLLEQMDRDLKEVLPEHRVGLDPGFDFSELEAVVPNFFGTQFQALKSIIPPRFYWEVPASASKVDEGLQHLLKQLESYNGEQVQIKTLPPIIVLLLNPEHGHLKPPISLRFSRPPKEEFNYYLCSNVIHLADDVDDPGHCVSQHRVAGGQYALVNDYVVSHPMTEEQIEGNIPPITTHAVIVTYYVLDNFRTPKLGTVGEIKIPNAYEVMGPLLVSDTTTVGRRPVTPFIDSLNDVMPNDIVALDAEYVVLEWANKRGDEPDYLRLQRKPHMSLARVSCILSSFTGDERIVMDDYVNTPEAVLDYVTQYSGIHEGDLDPNQSEKTLTTLKSTYMKLRALADRGVRFVGHGLSQDFRVCNVAIPFTQVIDTLEIYGKPGLRKLSLRFLAYHVLGERVQEDEHDSIEDARTSLRLYRRYEEALRQGTWEQLLQAVFQRGAETHWYVDSAKAATPLMKAASVSPEPERGTPPLATSAPSDSVLFPGSDEGPE